MMSSSASPPAALPLRVCLIIATVFWIYFCMTSMARWELLRQGDPAPRGLIALVCLFMFLPLWSLTTVSWRVGYDLKRWYRLLLINVVLAVLFGLCARPANYLATALVRDLSLADSIVRVNGPDPVRALKRWGSTTIEDGTQYLVLQGIVAAAAFYLRLQAQQAMSARLASEYDRARLQMLRMQTNPHFLFNTLSAIAGLVRARPAAAESMATRLGELFRATLADRNADFVPLQRELDLGRQYLEIQRTRFDERFTYEIHAPAHLASAPVPPLLLQPLLENAAEHGLANREGAIAVEVSCQLDGERVSIVVSNFAGIEQPEASPRPPSGFGLDNVRQRLQAAYGETAILSTRHTCSGHFEAQLDFPLLQGDCSSNQPAAIATLQAPSEVQHP
jgi:hypothetical protein